MKQISMTSPDVDKTLRNIYNAQFANTNDEKLKRVKRAMADIIKNDLTKCQRQALTLYFYENMTMTEIADTLDINVSTVSRNIARAKKKIFDRIKYYFY